MTARPMTQRRRRYLAHSSGPFIGDGWCMTVKVVWSDRYADLHWTWRGRWHQVMVGRLVEWS